MSIVGIDLGGTRIKIGRVDNRSLETERTVSAEPERPFSDHLNRLEPVIRELLDGANGSSDEIRGIGLSFPGIVDRETTTVLSTNKKYDGARDADIESRVEKQFNLPVILENDTRAALLGEWKHGAGEEENNLLMVTLGTGFGSAVLLQGKLLTGSHKQAGVLGGHITVQFDGYECTCGNRGCVETETGEWNLPRIVRDHERYQESRLTGMDTLNYRTLMELADSGDAVAEEILQRRFAYLGRGIVNLIHAYDPQRVVLGGGVMNRPDVVLPVVRKEVDRHSWSPRCTVELQPAEHPDHAALYGLNVLFEHDIEGI